MNKSVVIDGKEVFVFRFNDIDAVAANDSKQAIDYYYSKSQIMEDELYEYENIEKMDLETEIYEGEESKNKTSLKKILLEEKNNIPFIIASWDY